MGYHFVDTAKVIGDVQTFSIVEGFANRAELGYTRSVHLKEDSNVPSEGAFSQLWDYTGMNIFNGKVVAIKDGQFGRWTPGLAAGFLVRTGDHFVSSAVNKELDGSGAAYTNEDLYVAATKTWLRRAAAFPGEPGLEGHQRHHLRHWRAGHTVWGAPVRWARHPIARAVSHRHRAVGRIYPGAANREESGRHPRGRQGASAHDHGLRRARNAKENPHFAFDIGIGQVAGQIGTTYITGPGLRAGQPGGAQGAGVGAELPH